MDDSRTKYNRIHRAFLVFITFFFEKVKKNIYIRLELLNELDTMLYKNLFYLDKDL